MSLLLELAKEKRLPSHQPAGLGRALAKLAPVPVALSIVVLRSVEVALALALALSMAYLLARRAGLLLRALLTYVPPASLIAVVDYAFGSLGPWQAFALAYGLDVFLSLVLSLALLSAAETYRLLSALHIEYLALVYLNALEEIFEMMDAKRSRGWDYGPGLRSQLFVLLDAMKAFMMRYWILEESLRSRGVD
ncbi:MAG: hypothetical protein ABWK00_06525 [Desulfurococcaceae archaeon]